MRAFKASLLAALIILPSHAYAQDFLDSINRAFQGLVGAEQGQEPSPQMHTAFACNPGDFDQERIENWYVMKGWFKGAAGERTSDRALLLLMCRSESYTAMFGLRSVWTKGYTEVSINGRRAELDDIKVDMECAFVQTHQSDHGNLRRIDCPFNREQFVASLEAREKEEQLKRDAAMAEERAKKREAETKNAQARKQQQEKDEREKYVNKLRNSYAAYQFLQRCYEGRKGYELVHLNDRELAESKRYIAGIEKWATANDSNIDKDAEWTKADQQNRASFVTSINMDGAQSGQFTSQVVGACRSKFAFLQKQHESVSGVSAPRKDF